MYNVKGRKWYWKVRKKKLLSMSCVSELRKGIYTYADFAATVNRMRCYLLATASEDAFQHS